MSDHDPRSDRSGQPATTTVQAGGITLRGASISAYTTFLYTRDLNTIFDIGSVTEEMLSLDNVLISHCHADHLLGLTRYTSLRRLQRMNPPTITVPAEMIDGVKSLLAVWNELESMGNGTPPEVNLIPAATGEPIILGARRIARPFRVQHTLPSVGYTIYQQSRKLLPEFRNLSGQQIAAHRKRGIEVSQPHEKPLIRFIGDAMPSVFNTLADMEKVPLTIIESTFVLPDHVSLAEERGHLHIQHIRDRFDVFGKGDVVLTHFSRRYRRQDIERFIGKTLTEEQRNQVHLLY